MTSLTPLLKRLYEVIALFAVFNLMGVAGLIALLVASGALDRPKVRRVLAVLRGEELATEAGSTAGSMQPEAQNAEQRETAGMQRQVLVGSETDLKVLRTEAERIQAELDQRLALTNRILLRVMDEREQFRKEKEEAERLRQVDAEQRSEEGFRKQIAIYESLAPKVAVRHLLAVSDPDQAARILLEIDTRKAKKIVEAAKRGDQLEKMKVILRRVREVAPHRSGEFESEGTES